MNGVDAVVVNFDSGAHLAACVESLEATNVGRIVVVDNGSSDSSLETLETGGTRATILQAGRNLGYGSAVNLGARRCQGDLLLVCNADVRVNEGAVKALAAAIGEADDVAAAGPRVIAADGSTYPSAREFPSIADAAGHAFVGFVRPANRWSTRYMRLDADAGRAADVDWVSGSCFMVRRLAFDSVGGFDESYFMYVEDVDLCWRLGRAGWRTRFEPSAEVVHFQGVSTSRRPYRMLVAHHRSLWRFARRSSTGRDRALLPLVGAGLTARCALASAVHWRAGRRSSR